MKLLAWVVKLGFFLLVLWFALKNTTPVPVRFSADFTLDRVPLIVVMLICVAARRTARRPRAGLADLQDAARSDAAARRRRRSSRRLKCSPSAG